MENSGVIIPSDIGKIINERSAIWQNLDETQRQFDEMNKLAPQVSSSAAAQIPPELTEQKTPPAEVIAAAQGFQTELARIAKTQEAINVHQAEIKRIKSQQVTVAVIVAVFLCFLGCGGIAMINSLLNH